MAGNSDASPRYRVMRMLAAYSTNICMACGTSVLGPTLVSMGYLLHTDTTHMSLALSGQRLGYLAGTILCGVYFSRVPILAELQFAICCLGVGVTMALAAWQQEVYSFISVIILMGVGLGYIDAGMQVYVMHLWKGHRSRNSILQSLHFNWSAFATVLPFVISLFLRDIPESHLGQHKANISSTVNISAAHMIHSNQSQAYVPVSFFNRSDSTDNAMHNYNLSGDIVPGEEIYLADGSDVGLVRWAYVSLAGLVLVNTVYIFIVYLITKNSHKQPQLQPQQQQKEPILEEKTEKSSMEKDDFVTIEVHRDTPQCYRKIILVFLFMFAFLYQCVEGIPGGFLTAFCAQGLHWHLEKGAVLTMAYWGAQGVGRLLSMFLSWAISPRTLIILNLTLLSCGYLLLQFVIKLGPESMWVAMALGGLGLGSSLPSSFLWVSDYMAMTSVVSATVLAGSCLAGVLVLPLTGYLFDSLGPMTMVYILGIAALFFVLTFIGMQLWASYGIQLFTYDDTNSEEEIHIDVDGEKGEIIKETIGKSYENGTDAESMNTPSV